MSDARNLWEIKREEIHLGSFLKIQKGKHKILISIYWFFFLTSIFYQLRWREKSWDPRGIKDRKKTKAERREGRRMMTRQSLVPDAGQLLPGPLSLLPQGAWLTGALPPPCAWPLVSCPELLAVAPRPHFLTPAQRLQVPTPSHLGWLPRELSAEAQRASLLPWVPFPSAP